MRRLALAFLLLPSVALADPAPAAQPTPPQPQPEIVRRQPAAQQSPLAAYIASIAIAGAQANAQVETLDGDIGALQRRLGALATETEKLKTDNATLTTENGKLKTDNAALIADAQKLKADLGTVTMQRDVLATAAEKAAPATRSMPEGIYSATPSASAGPNVVISPTGAVPMSLPSEQPK